ncbi:HDOD domain-containing protein [Rheinheimera riviphila]|uniref:HDOD domain-containing protein n=1 Tax=Rheinheimera riviphila TaxID=1834037 RepID=A0A437R0P3_9GAMM|nr:HDOD domain-containing protein [Rheinheimera riviphila]RVU40287.1 HDOD domain-containing protein [Rheinheimera riviphila]
MYCYMARQPILDAEKNLYGYELLFRDGVANCFPNINADEATSKLITEHHLLMGVEKITGSRMAFINFSADTLIHHFPTSIDPKSMVIEILETVPISRELLTACRELHRMGYQLALDDHDFEPKWDIFLPYISIIKVDVQQFNMLQISKYISRIKHHPVTLLAEKVETAAEYQKLKQLGFNLFQGYFFARPEMLKHKKIASSKLNLLLLISESSKVELDFDQLSAIVERDLGLSYKLLRFVNSSSFAREKPIGSLKHAMVYMGEAELKKFIALLALANLSEDNGSELLNMSMVRARFCDLMAQMNHDPENPPSAFLTGLFSLVDALLEQPLADLLEDLPILPEIKEALVAHQGKLGQYLELAKAFEQADWELQQQLSQKLFGKAIDLSPHYMQAVDWAHGLLLTARSN